MPLLASTVQSPAALSHKQVCAIVSAGFTNLLGSWERSMRLVWKSSDPQAVIDECGPDAATTFQSSALTAKYLAQMSELIFDAATHAANLRRIAAIAALVKPFTAHEDGTVTIDEP